jgi:1-acyl-sn-glycerol-3-phosphate acyltransferase
LAVFSLVLAVQKRESRDIKPKEIAMLKQNFLKSALVFIAMFAMWIFRQPILITLNWISNREAVTTSLQPLGIWGPVALFVLLILQVFLAFIPGQALMVACSYLYGFWYGLFLAWTGLFVGGQAAFWLARCYGRPFAERWVSPQVLAEWDKAAKDQTVPFYVAALVLPIFPNDAMCYVAGLGKISSRRFTLANMLGRGIACLLASIVGAYRTQIPLSIWIGTAIIVTFICITWKLLNNRNHLNNSIRKEWLANSIYTVCRIALKAYAILFHRTYKVSGLENLPKGAKIIALNHTVGCDPLHLPLIFGEKVHFLLQDGYFSMPVIGWMLKETEQIPVYRGTDKAKEALAQACDLLRAGKTIVIFPEGKEVSFGERITAKTGVVRMALETGTPIIPLGTYVPRESLNTVHITWKGEKCSGFWQFTGKRYMRFGSPWYPGQTASETKPMDFHSATKELMDQIYSLVDEAQKEVTCESPTSLNPIPQW